MSDYFSNLAKLSEPDASQIQARQRLVGPGGVVILTEEPDPPLEGVYVLAIPGTTPVLKVRVNGVTHDLLGGGGASDVTGELELIAQGETVTVESGRQLLLHGQLTVEGSLIVDGTLALI